MDCLFCAIAAKNIPSKPVYEDEHVYAFHDIAPHAPVHVLVIPKRHIESLDVVDSDTISDAAKALEVIPKIATELGLANGYRVITNIGKDGGQTVKHLHFHILGGKELPVRFD